MREQIKWDAEGIQINQLEGVALQVSDAFAQHKGVVAEEIEEEDKLDIHWR